MNTHTNPDKNPTILRQHRRHAAMPTETSSYSFNFIRQVSLFYHHDAFICFAHVFCVDDSHEGMYGICFVYIRLRQCCLAVM